MKNNSIKIFLGIIALFVIGFIFRPFFHSLVMHFIIHPLELLMFLLIIFGGWKLARIVGPVRVVQTSSNNYTISGSGKMTPGIFFLLISTFVILVVALSVEEDARLSQGSKEINYAIRTTLPTFDPIRLTPKDVATRYAEDSFQSPQERLSDSQIVLVDGRLKRVFPRVPDGWLLYLTNKMTGFVVVDVDTLSRQVTSIDQEFPYSQEVGIFDNLYYQLELKKYFVTYSSEPIYLKASSNEWVTVVPYMTYKGFIFRTPEWGGVMVLHPNGKIEDFTPEEAQKIPYMQGNRIYPKELANFHADAYAYKDGLLNKWFLHKNQTEIVSLPNSEAVLHVATTEGYKQMFVAEPYGRSYGIYKIFFFDATTGKAEIVDFDQNSQLTGPIAATDYVRKEFPSYDWSSFSLSEPRPLTINGTLYWLLSIVPNDSAGIAGTVLLNAKTNNVLKINTEAELKSLINGVPVTPSTTDTTDALNTQLKSKIESIEQQLNELKALIK